METLSDIVTESDMLIKPTKKGINLEKALSQTAPEKYMQNIEQGKPDKTDAYILFLMALLAFIVMLVYLVASLKTIDRYDSEIKKHKQETIKNA